MKRSPVGETRHSVSGRQRLGDPLGSWGYFDESAVGHFAPVRVNDALTLDFAGSDYIAIHHYAFKVSEDEFDAIFKRIEEEGIPYGSEPSRARI